MPELEARTLLSIDIQIDYSLDTSNFFNTVAKRALLQAAANAVGNALNDNLLAIQPSGSNTWMESFPNPSTGQIDNVSGGAIAANTIIIYVGGRTLPGQTEAGEGSTGGVQASGDQNWLNLVESRGQAGALLAKPTDFGPWGGSISFDNSGSTNWYFGQDTSSLGSSQVDFFTVAEHEICHVLGFGTSPSWTTYVSGTNFTGPASEAANAGNPVPLDAAAQHWAPGTISGGAPAVMDPSIATGQRLYLSPLDYAGLTDIGWSVTPPSQLSSVTFRYDTYTVSPTGGNLLVTVVRTGGEGPTTVNYATSGGTAASNVDYTPVTGTLNFAAGQMSQTFSVPILNDQSLAGNVTFDVTLSNPGSNTSLGSPSTALVTIVKPGDKAPVDFQGGGFSEVGVFRPSTAQWITLGQGGVQTASYGATNLYDIPVPGDYDGVGRSELAVFRPSTGQWIIRNPVTNTTRTVSFGATNLYDIPVPGDYDGIGRTELAIFRPSTGQWYIRNPITNTTRIVSYGAWNMVDIPVPGDYDGVGRTELAVFRPSTGQWIIRNPITNTTRTVSYGAWNLFDIPAPGDYDGVGRTELAVFRPSTGQWIIRNPITNTTRYVSFGATNLYDYPLEGPTGSLAKLKSLGTLHTAAFAASGTSAGVSVAPAVTNSIATTAAVAATAPRPAAAFIQAQPATSSRRLPAQDVARPEWLTALDQLATD